MADRPNILILMVDQLTGAMFPDGPASFLTAPRLKRLAEESLRFNAAYCPSPLCLPSRMGFLTGLMPSRIGVYDNASEMASAIPTFAHHLRRAGYRTVLSGKMHFAGADQLHGFEERLTTDIYPADFGWTPDWTAPETRFDWWYHNYGSVTGAGVAETTNQLEFDDEVAYHARRQLYEFARGGDERPFCLTVSFTHPHDPYVARRRYWDLYDGVDIPAPTVPAIAFEDQDPHSKRLMQVCDWRNYPMTDDDIARARRAYCANVSYLDDQIDGILKVLEECGLADDTVIIFMSDHGDMLGERGLWFKMSFFESSVRVPLMIAAPGRLSPGSVSTPVSTLDMLPTLVELIGDKAPDGLDGHSLFGPAEGHGRAAPVFAEFAGEGAVAPMAMVRTDGFKYVKAAGDPPQLFNLSEDPHERTNLAAVAEHSGRVADLDRRVSENWDLEQVHREVLQDQARRRLVDAGLRQGRYNSWDFQPLQPAADRFMRNHLDLNEVEHAARFPRDREGSE